MDFIEAMGSCPDGSIGKAVMSGVYRVDPETDEIRLRLVQFPFLVFHGKVIGLN